MKFATFLAKYSTVNARFIYDFYDILKEDFIDKYDEFLIDGDILCKWLKIKNRHNFVATVKRSYRKDIDYIITTIKNKKGRGGHNIKKYILTPNAAKRLCMSTKSSMGPVVQDYFIEIEFILYRYKNYIIKGMEKKIRQLENNQTK